MAQKHARDFSKYSDWDARNSVVRPIPMSIAAADSRQHHLQSRRSNSNASRTSYDSANSVASSRSYYSSMPYSQQAEDNRRAANASRHGHNQRRMHRHWKSTTSNTQNPVNVSAARATGSHLARAVSKNTVSRKPDQEIVNLRAALSKVAIGMNANKPAKSASELSTKSSSDVDLTYVMNAPNVTRRRSLRSGSSTNVVVEATPANTSSLTIMKTGFALERARFGLGQSKERYLVLRSPNLEVYDSIVAQNECRPIGAVFLVGASVNTKGDVLRITSCGKSRRFTTIASADAWALELAQVIASLSGNSERSILSTVPVAA